MKIFISAFFLNLLFLNLSFAQDCSFSGKVIKDGSKVTLFSPGKSLENFKVQDQDGLSTCYANTTSVILKTMMEGHPDVSYLDIALKHGTKGSYTEWKEGNPEENKFITKSGKDLTASGSVCTSLSVLKDSGVCPEQYFSFESNARRLSSDDNNKQNVIMDSLSNYFDQYYKGQKEDANSTNTVLAKTHKILLDQKNLFQKQCENLISGGKPEDVMFKESLKDNVAWIRDFIFYTLTGDEKEDPNITKNKSCALYAQDFLNTLQVEPFVLGKEEFTGEINANLQPELSQRIIDAHIDLNQILGDKSSKQVTAFNDLDQYNKSIAEAYKINLEMKALFTQRYNKFNIDQKATSDPCEKNSDFPINRVVRKTGGTNRRILADIGYSRSSAKSCENFKMIDFLSNEKNIKDIQESVACAYHFPIDSYLSSYTELLKLGRNMDKVEDLLAPIRPPSINTIEDILAPDCASHLLKVDEYNCENIRPVTRDEAGFPKYRSTFRTQVQKDLSLGRPLGINICTHFFDNPDLNTKFCSSNMDKDENNNGQHIVPVTGYRCSKGKIGYEILNSWGKSCTMADFSSKYKNKTFECELDNEGEPTGKFWVEEKALLYNMRSFAQITLPAPVVNKSK
ncbi:MAG: hypothetical protein ACOYL6_05085 [Bacteriovoracaceae bacterium]